MPKFPLPGARKTIKIPLRQRLAMIGGYAGKRLGAQLKAVAFVVLYLLSVQILLLRTPIKDALGAALGVGAVVVGLALFLEGLFLGVMPLGERCGLRLPGKAGGLGIMLFSLVLGVTATLAEPAIGFLKALGGSVEAWRAPLLYLLLNRGAAWLVGAIASGVGIAVLLGVFRFIKGWRLRPFLFVLIPILLAITFLADWDPRLAGIAGLAWDSGGVTTGPVTVPLIIALGVGLSRILGGNEEAGGGLGVVTLASALPILAVFILGAVLAPQTPIPSTPEAFFSPAHRGAALFVVGSEDELRGMARKTLGPAAFASAFPAEASTLAEEHPEPAASPSPATGGVEGTAALRSLIDALKAVLPLVLVLAAVLRLFLGERIEAADELVLGLVFAVAGMFLFSLGMERGLSSLGRETGRSLPSIYTDTDRSSAARLLEGVDESMVLGVASEGGTEEYLLVAEGEEPKLVPFHRERFDPERETYLYVPVKHPLLAGAPAWAGYAAVLLFVFVLGIGATLAEPSLSALGTTLEEITTGTYKRAALVRTVAVGVGLGMAAGFARILFNLPLVWILLPPYLLALALTAISSEDFVAIAWDSAGVTTGPVTVPLVIATGLGIGERAGAAESFGVVAAASVFPVLAVLASGIVRSARVRRALAQRRLS